jgi:arylsulfatase A-like enzyme
LSDGNEQRRRLRRHPKRASARSCSEGVIPAGRASPYFVAHTDLFPTFLEATDIPPPPHLHFDGVSLLPVPHRAQPAPANRKELRKAWNRRPTSGYDALQPPQRRIRRCTTRIALRAG